MSEPTFMIVEGVLILGRPGRVDHFKAAIREHGFTIVQSNVERAVGSILEGSLEIVGAPLVVVGVPTEEEARAHYEAVGVNPPRARFQYRVTAD